jgi:TPR repeat protein
MIEAIRNQISGFAGSILVLCAYWVPVSAEAPLHSNPSLDLSVTEHFQPADKAHTDKNPAKMEKTCEAGDGAACNALGHTSRAKMFEYFKAACDAGYADGCYETGRIIMRSDGGPNGDKALLLFSKGCDGGSASACYFKAELLHDGELVPQDLEAARAAEERGVELLRRQGVELATPVRNRAVKPR